MSLVFLGSGKASTLCHADLANMGNPLLASEIELRSYLLAVTAWSSASPTAKAILKAVHDAPTTIYLVGMKGGGFSCFNSDYPTKGVGVIYYNLTMKMEVRFTGPGPRDNASTFVSKPKPSRPLHNYIGFLHELGHAKQYIENPLFFDGAAQNTPKFGFMVQAKARNMMEAKYGEGAAWKHLKLAQLRMCKPSWSVRIETDNLARHEWPMCKELGYPERQYSDLAML